MQHAFNVHRWRFGFCKIPEPPPPPPQTPLWLGGNCYSSRSKITNLVVSGFSIKNNNIKGYKYFSITYVSPSLKTTFSDLNQQNYVQSEHLKELSKFEDVNKKIRISVFIFKV